MATPMHGYGFSGSAERRRRRPHAVSSKTRRVPGLGMDILETRMLLAAGFITGQSWQVPVSPTPTTTIAFAPQNATAYTVPGTNSRVVVEPIMIVNDKAPSSAPTFAVRILSHTAGSPVEQYIVLTAADSTAAEKKITNPNTTDTTSQSTTASQSSLTTNPAPAPKAISKAPVVPWSQDVKVSGTVPAANGSTVWSIPIGPQTSSLKVDVSPDETAQTDMRPAVDELDLVSHDGSVLASMQGVSAATASQGPHQDINIDFSNIPTGAQLLLRLVASPGISTPVTTQSSSLPTSTPTSAPTPTSASVGTTGTGVGVPYKMEVQRSDSPVTVVTIGAAYPFASPVSSVANGLIVAGNLLGPGSTTLASTAARASGLQPVDLRLAGKSEEAQSPEAIPDRAADQDGLSAPEISVGPLASRGSAPLGPLLGTIQGDRTYSIDRDERAFDLAMEQLGSGVGLEIALVGPQGQTGSVGRDSADPQSVSPPDASGSLTPLRGTGGFPVLVSSSGATQSNTDATALLATLPPALGRDASPADSSVPDLTPLTLSRPEEQARDEAARTDFLTSACGLVLGVGLATGPLYPDLIGLVRTCLPRAVRPRGRTRRAPGSRNLPLHKFMSWLRFSRG